MSVAPGIKVSPGGPLTHWAEDHNSFLDAAAANKRLALGASPRQAQGTPVIRSYNASGFDAPWRGVVEISDTGATAEMVEFVQPGHTDGIGLYGIALHPITTERAGLIAIAGGPWEVLTSGEIATGAIAGPQAHSWMAEGGGATVWEVIRGTVDGVALVMFAGGVGIEIRDDDPAPEDLYEGRVWFNTSAV